jgi:hypothetical protein
MRRAIRTIGLTLAVLLAVGVVAAQAEPQLGGIWVLDRSQSQLPMHRGKGHHAQAAPTTPPAAPATPPQITLLVDQQAGTLKATRTMARGDHERSMSVTYVTNGADRVHQGRRGTAVTRAAYDGDRFVITNTFSKQSDQGPLTMSRQSVWTVSPDGKMLTIDTTFQSPRGTHSFKSVYLRG